MDNLVAMAVASVRNEVSHLTTTDSWIKRRRKDQNTQINLESREIQCWITKWKDKDEDETNNEKYELYHTHTHTCM